MSILNTDQRTPQAPIRLPSGVDPVLQQLTDQVNQRLGDLNRTLVNLTQGIYEKYSTQPYFLPRGGQVGAVLIFVQRVDNAGRVFDSAEWLAPGSAGQTLQSNGPGLPPSWV